MIKTKSSKRTRRITILKSVRYFYNTCWKLRRRRIPAALIFFALLLYFRPRRVFPIYIPAPAKDLKVPRHGENILQFANEYARERDLPVYIFYKARSGQLNNQLISFFNALTIAKAANATLVSPFAFYGPEAFDDFETGRSLLFFLKSYFNRYIMDNLRRQLGIDHKRDQLVGDYFDGTLINKTQPVVSIVQFLMSKGADHLREFPHVLTRKGDAPYYFATLKRWSIFGRDVNIRLNYIGADPLVASEHIASRKELDCNFNISTFYRGLPFHTGVNGNYLFLTKLYRSHSLNCSSHDPYWLQVRKYVQPRADIRELVNNAIDKWGNVLAIHLRLFPRDNGKFSTESFCNNLLTRYDEILRQANHIYVAYSVTSAESTAIVLELRRRLGQSRIITAADYGNLRSRGPHFDMRYIVPIIDMWTAVQSRFFIGRMASSLSWNVIYWREALEFSKEPFAHFFYKLEDFSERGEKNPSDSASF